MKLIDKDALVAEIEKMQDAYIAKLESRGMGHEEAVMASISYVNGIKDVIDTLEVKEVDLEKEIKEEYLKRRCYGGRDNILVILNEPQFNEVAKHFFELGFKSQKGEDI